MTPDTALWIAGVLIPAAIGWAITIAVVLMKTKKDTSLLVTMHRKPDEYGFGTVSTNENLKDNTRAVRSLTHYIKWFVEAQTGKEPPPPLEGGATTSGSD